MEKLTENQATEASKQKITFFSATDKSNQTLDEFMPDLVMSEATTEAVQRMIEKGFYTGNTTNVLINLPGFSLVYAWFKSGFQLPVHSHNADCLYYVVAGEAILGNRRVKAGDGFFVPKDVFYSYTAGPEGIEILEFRHANLIDMVWRDSKPEYWDNVVDNIDKSQEKWKVETPPTRASTGLG
ncbi:cupin domain-containing protein [Bacillus dakarensis]|uniref:cupin domain-containing protein n=1 Tax=Robertmurraya dakarensis TaxID=1926278 RepID=UPI000981CA40|nr:hypothetical protein [Bacillus dakarensis]